MSVFKLKQSDLRRLLKDQHYRCALTGRPLSPETTSLDHKLPYKHGGDNSIDNVHFVHRDVNIAKGTMRCEEFIALCREVVACVDAPGDVEL